MKLTFTFVLLFACLPLFAQWSDNFQTTEVVPCPFNSGVNIRTYKNWVIYQTLEGTWNGTIDSTHCITVAAVSIQNYLQLDDVDLEKPIFLRYKFNDNTKVLLQSNYVYAAQASKFWQNDVAFQSGTDCPENLCSGLFIGIEIPDSTGQGTFMRWYSDSPDFGNSDGSFQTCVPTEYFSDNYLREFIIKMTLVPGTTNNQEIRLWYAEFSEYPGPPPLINDFVTPEWTFADTSYEVPLYYIANEQDPWAGTNYLLLYEDYGYWPSAAHISYVEGTPTTNTPEPQTINVLMNEWEVFVPQPFALFRGALTEGSDSVRHKVNFVNNGGDICLSGIIDLVFDGGSKYIHHGGNLNFEGISSCMMFKNGASLEVGDNTTLQYGQAAKGILALRPGSTIQLGKGSKLQINNLLWVQGIPTWQFPEPQIYMELNAGSTLEFGKGSNIFNGLSHTPDTHLNIYMNGGILIDDQLSAEARQLIHKIYPKPKSRFADNLSIAPNPVQDKVLLQYIAAHEEALWMEIVDMNGRKMHQVSLDAIQGFNTFQLDMNLFPQGIYLAFVHSSTSSVSLKIVKE